MGERARVICDGIQHRLLLYTTHSTMATSASVAYDDDAHDAACDERGGVAPAEDDDVVFVSDAPVEVVEAVDDVEVDELDVDDGTTDTPGDEMERMPDEEPVLLSTPLLLILLLGGTRSVCAMTGVTDSMLWTMARPMRVTLSGVLGTDVYVTSNMGTPSATRASRASDKLEGSMMGSTVAVLVNAVAGTSVACIADAAVASISCSISLVERTLLYA